MLKNYLSPSQRTTNLLDQNILQGKAKRVALHSAIKKDKISTNFLCKNTPRTNLQYVEIT